MDYLKDPRYYEDLYDLHTIKHCLDRIDLYKMVRKELSTDQKAQEIPEEERLRGLQMMLNLDLMQLKADRYQKRQQTIEKWFERDRTKQDKLDNAPEPQNISCASCRGSMACKSRHLEDYTDKPLRVLFFFHCPTCKKIRALYDNGEDYATKPDLCEKCRHELTIDSSHTKNTHTLVRNCPSCGFHDEDTFDFKKSQKEREQREKEEKELLEKYRSEFCFSEQEGKEHVELVEAMKFAKEVYDHELQKFNDAARDAAAEINKLNGPELETLLAKPLEEERYKALQFDKPEISKHVIIPFTVQDADSSRRGDQSTRPLEKLIKSLLEDTNWRLQDDLSYRLGYVSGRLKGYEQEEDLIKLARKNTDVPKLPPLDHEKLMKYGSHSYVQLARLNAQFKGTEDQRKRRLQKKPDGFFLESEEGPYSCFICGDHKPGNEIWWNLQGMRCKDCRRNIIAGVIPDDLPHQYNQNVYFKDWQISSDYGVHSATARKMRREGLLHGRDLKREDGAVYCTIYLFKENREFLEKYPKKERPAPNFGVS